MTIYILISCAALHIYFLVTIIKKILCKLRRRGKLSVCTSRKCPSAEYCEYSATHALIRASEILEQGEDLNEAPGAEHKP